MWKHLSFVIPRYATNVFSKQYHPTTGVEFYLKRTTLPGSKNLALKLWDVSGQALTGRMLDKYIFGAHAVMLVYDVANTASFDSLEDWLELCRAALVGAEKPPTYALVANKIDLEHLRAIKSDRHHKFAQENGLLTYAVSAKTGEGVSLCMQKIAADLLGKILNMDRASYQLCELYYSRHQANQARARTATDCVEGQDYPGHYGGYARELAEKLRLCCL